MWTFPGIQPCPFQFFQSVSQPRAEGPRGAWESLCLWTAGTLSRRNSILSPLDAHPANRIELVPVIVFSLYPDVQRMGSCAQAATLSSDTCVAPATGPLLTHLWISFNSAEVLFLEYKAWILLDPLRCHYISIYKQTIGHV